MTRILLIRHGSTDLHNSKLCGRMPGVSLNAKGLRQATDLGALIHQQVRLDALYSSPLERAVETASAIAEPQSVQLVTDPEIIEMEFGSWTGISFKELHNLPEWHEYNQRRSLRSAPGGETLTDVQARAARFLSRIVADNRDRTVGVVTHADVIRAMLVLLLGMPLDFLLRLTVDPASVSDVSLGGAYPVVNGLNIKAPEARSLSPRA